MNTTNGLSEIESELAELEQILQESKANSDMQLIEQKLNEVEKGIQLAHSRNQTSEDKVSTIDRADNKIFSS